MNSLIGLADFCLSLASSCLAFLQMSAGWNITERFHLNSSTVYFSRSWVFMNMFANRLADLPFINDNAIIIFCMSFGVC